MKIILIGSGKLVYFLAKYFVSNQHKLTIITKDLKEATNLSHQFSATSILANLIEEQTLFKEVNELVSLAEGKLTVMELNLPENSPVKDKMLQEINFPKEVLIGCIVRNGEVMIPAGNTILKVYDRLILIGKPENQDDLLYCLTGKYIKNNALF
jgi:trk system potassium uptake protein